MTETWDGWLTLVAAVGAALSGAVARVLHIWTQRDEKAKADGVVTPRLTWLEFLSAAISSIVLGVIAYGVGKYFDPPMPDATIGAMAGFAGLMGPSALLALWERLVDPVVRRVTGGSPK